MTNEPYANLGITLRAIRSSKGIGIKRIARALDLDHSYLSKIELGRQRPSKQVLNQLINFFKLNEREANDIFMLAGYRRGVVTMKDEQLPDKNTHSSFPELIMKTDQLTLYSDAVRVDANVYGIVLSFAQALGPNQQIIVSRIGMSKEHVKSLINVLQKLIDKTEGKSETREVLVN